MPTAGAWLPSVFNDERQQAYDRILRKNPSDQWSEQWGQFREAGVGPIVLGLRALPRQPPPSQHKQHCQRKVDAAEVQVAKPQPAAKVKNHRADAEA